MDADFHFVFALETNAVERFRPAFCRLVRKIHRIAEEFDRGFPCVLPGVPEVLVSEDIRVFGYPFAKSLLVELQRIAVTFPEQQIGVVDDEALLPDILDDGAILRLGLFRLFEERIEGLEVFGIHELALCRRRRGERLGAFGHSFFRIGFEFLHRRSGFAVEHRHEFLDQLFVVEVGIIHHLGAQVVAQVEKREGDGRSQFHFDKEMLGSDIPVLPDEAGDRGGVVDRRLETATVRLPVVPDRDMGRAMVPLVHRLLVGLVVRMRKREHHIPFDFAGFGELVVHVGEANDHVSLRLEAASRRGGGILIGEHHDVNVGVFFTNLVPELVHEVDDQAGNVMLLDESPGIPGKNTPRGNHSCPRHKTAGTARRKGRNGCGRFSHGPSVFR